MGSTMTKSIMIKEMKLSASCLSYWFILFGLMFFLPGYPGGVETVISPKTNTFQTAERR